MKRRTVVLSYVFGFVAVSLYLLRIVTLSNRADWGAVVGVGFVVGTLLFTLLAVWGAVVWERRRLRRVVRLRGGVAGCRVQPGAEGVGGKQGYLVAQSHSLEWLPPRWGRLSSLRDVGAVETYYPEAETTCQSWKVLCRSVSTGRCRRGNTSRASQVRGCDRVI